MKPLLMIVDDDPGIREVVSMQLQDAGYRTVEAEHGVQALKLYLEEPAALVLTDIRMPCQDGLDLLQSLIEHDPNCTVIVMTAFASVETAVDAMKAGAFDFLVKPFREERLLTTIQRALQLVQLKQENQQLRQVLAAQGKLADTRSEKMRQLYDQATAVADTDACVLIRGETGTGKEQLARYIHQHSHRSQQPLVVVNCGALPETLVEAELFGHAKGAFTGATQARQGRIQSAAGGTLFLDEIGDLPLNSQVKLLRFLQEGEVQAVGSDMTIKIDLRVIAATHQDLETMIQEGSFREDLYYRLNVIQLSLPPLRERPEDIAPLIDHFLSEAALLHQRQAPELNSAALKRLEACPWPGNVRQLKNLCERWTLLYAGRELGPEIIESDLAQIQSGGDPWQLPPEGIDLAALERNLISQAMARTGGNKSQTAKLLGISRHTLDYRLEKYQLS